MTHTCILGIGTNSSRIALDAMVKIIARGNADRASAVVVFAEDPATLGANSIPGVRWHKIPNMLAIRDAISDHPEDYPWLSEDGIKAIVGLAGAAGDGLAASPGAGRAGFTQVAPALFNTLADIQKDVSARGDDLEVLLITVTTGGTSRGALREAGPLVKLACPQAKVRRNVVVLPCFSVRAAPWEHQRRADNALTALQIIHEGMLERERSFMGPAGRRETISTSLANDVLLVNPAYQADPFARVKELTSLDDIVEATSRIVVGLAGREQPWQALIDRTLDSTTQRQAGRRWVGAANEARIYFDEERLRAAVARAVIDRMIAGLRDVA